MAGVTNVAFRTLCRRYGGGLYVSEMLSARAVLECSPKTMRKQAFGEDERPRSAQLFTTDPVVAGLAVEKMVAEVGVDHIDLNFGCPAPKVTRRGAGAALPTHPRLFARIVEAAVAAAGGVPVTVKMRWGLDDDHTTALVAGRLAVEAGAAAVALHARTAEQLYSGSADWRHISAVVADLSGSGVPVLGNGDIWDAGDALRMMAETGCDGVVVGRGCLGRPWLFRDLEDALAGRPVRPAPSLGEVAEVLLEHARLLCDHLGERAGCRDMRKHMGWYLSGYPVGGDLRKRFGEVVAIADIEARIAELDPSQRLPEGRPTVKRGHTNGPRRPAVPDGWLTAEAMASDESPEGADLGGRLLELSGG